MKVRYLKKLIFMAAFMFISASLAQGATFTVDDTNDTVDSTPGDGICADASGNCTLRAAIEEANASGGAEIQLPVGTYNLSLGALSINGGIVINGDCAPSTIIDGGAVDRVFHVTGGINNEINRVTIRNGSITGEGGGILNAGTLTITNSIISGNAASGSGGGIKNNNNGILTIDNSTISGNNATGAGGGIKNIGTLAIGYSTISGNTSVGDGGAIHISSPTTPPNVAFTKCTISGNNATGSGGGIFNTSSGAVAFTNCTISGNNAVANIGGIRTTSGGNMSLQNTIVAGNTGGASPDCSGTITSLGNNLIGDTTGCTISGGTGDLTGVAPGLNAFLDPGSPGWGRHPLSSSSVARDSGNDAAASADDQLGNPHIDILSIGAIDISDIGAIEFYPVVNGHLTFEIIRSSRKTTPKSSANFDKCCNGNWTFTFKATLKNAIGGDSLDNLIVEVHPWTDADVTLLNANGGPGGVGAQLTVVEEPTDGILDPGESVVVEFIICVQDKKRFNFFVNILGETLPLP